MKIKILTTSAGRRFLSAFTLVETMIAVLGAAVMLPTLYAGFACGFSYVQMTRENLRATQIILQRMEGVRLASYNGLLNGTVFPTNSVEYYSPSAAVNSRGAAYNVTYNWAPGPSTLPPSYRSNMVLVTVTAAWNS